MKKRFFDPPANLNPNILAITTNYLINEWLDDADKQMFLDMKVTNPRRYQVAGLGHWGIVHGLVYENFISQEFDFNLINSRPSIKAIFGLDFGYTNDPTALFCALVDTQSKEIFVFNELYKKALSNLAIFNNISKMGFSKEVIYADSAEPKSIDELKSLGLTRIRPASKGKDSVNNSIQFIQNFKIIIKPSCSNFLNEVSNYTWSKDKFGNPINKPIDNYNHLLDAMRYAFQALSSNSNFSFK